MATPQDIEKPGTSGSSKPRARLRDKFYFGSKKKHDPVGPDQIPTTINGPGQTTAQPRPRPVRASGSQEPSHHDANAFTPSPVKSPAQVPISNARLDDQSTQMSRQQATSSTAHEGKTTKITSIHELWNEAYEALRAKDPGLISDYEANLIEHMKTSIGVAVVFSTTKIGRKVQMNIHFEGEG